MSSKEYVLNIQIVSMMFHILSLQRLFFSTPFSPLSQFHDFIPRLFYAERLRMVPLLKRLARFDGVLVLLLSPTPRFVRMSRCLRSQCLYQQSSELLDSCSSNVCLERKAP